jgi:hypothetical protein
LSYLLANFVAKERIKTHGKFGLFTQPNDNQNKIHMTNFSMAE